MLRYDVAVVGAGIVGLAAAREILSRQPGTSLVMIEKEAEIGTHQSGHNSGVIHSGIYYVPGTLKARLCVSGAAEMYAYCQAKGIPTDRCGKLIVAADESELARLEELHRRGLANGVQDLSVIGPDAIREIEPHCAGVRALWSPNTGIVDYGRVAQAYAGDVRAAGGDIFTSHELRGLREGAEGVLLETSGGELVAGRVLTCAGLYSDRVAELTGAPREPRIVPFRGDYWQIKAGRRHLARNLIYPVPDPNFPFLGVHFTRRLDDGAVWLGPNAVLAFSREGYGRLDTRPADLAQALANPGFRRLAGRYWRSGLGEMYRDVSKRAFLKTCQRYVPELTLDDMEPGPSGVRAQALGRDGKLVDDFIVNVQGTRLMHVRNAPSPAATSSLAIGRLIADAFEQAA